AVDAEKYYMIDLTHWVCSCMSLLNSRFLICKHLVYCAIEKEKAYNSKGIRLLYSNFKQYTDCPFLILNSNNSQNQSLNILDINTKLLTQVNIKNDLITIDKNEENFDPELHQLCKSKIVVLEHLVEHLNNELSANNLRHVSNIVNNMKHTFTIADDIKSSQCKDNAVKLGIN
ncbi:45491_t:CDS:1, partial [Gigaspora margarita]